MNSDDPDRDLVTPRYPPPDESILRLTFTNHLVDLWLQIRRKWLDNFDCLTDAEVHRLRFHARRLYHTGEPHVRKRW